MIIENTDSHLFSLPNKAPTTPWIPFSKVSVMNSKWVFSTRVSIPCSVLTDAANQVWMSHGDQLSALPPSFHVIGKTTTAPFAAVAHDSKPLYGIQFHAEVTHSPLGKEIIGRFVVKICECRTNWTMEEFIGKEIKRIRDICGEKGRVIGAVSGGVDSTVAAKLMHEAIGDRYASGPGLGFEIL